MNKQTEDKIIYNVAGRDYLIVHRLFDVDELIGIGHQLGVIE